MSDNSIDYYLLLKNILENFWGELIYLPSVENKNRILQKLKKIVSTCEQTVKKSLDKGLYLYRFYVRFYDIFGKEVVYDSLRKAKDLRKERATTPRTISYYFSSQGQKKIPGQFEGTLVVLSEQIDNKLQQKVRQNFENVYKNMLNVDDQLNFTLEMDKNDTPILKYSKKKKQLFKLILYNSIIKEMESFYSSIQKNTRIKDDIKLLDKITYYEYEPKIQKHIIEELPKIIKSKKDIYYPFLYETAYFLKYILGYKEKINGIDIFLIFLRRIIGEKIDKKTKETLYSYYHFLRPGVISTPEGNKIYCIVTCEIKLKNKTTVSYPKIISLLDKPIGFLSLCGLLYSSAVYQKLLEKTAGESYSKMGGKEIWDNWRKLQGKR